MTLKTLVAASVLAGGLFAAATADATTLLFTYSEAGGYHFSFEQSSNPAPVSYALGHHTTTPVTDWSGDAGPNPYVTWFSTTDLGAFDTPNLAVNGYGPQVYTGSEDAPVFAPGTFDVFDSSDQLNGVLTVTSAAPEPAAWAMMLMGLGGIGALARRRRASALSPA